MPVIQRINLGAADFAHLDWTDPANAPPQSARPFRCTAQRVVFDIIGKADTTEDGASVDVGAMVVDGFLWFADGDRRGVTVIETGGSPLSTRIRLEAQGEIRAEARINLTLTGVAIAACEVRLVSGGRLLQGAI